MQTLWHSILKIKMKYDINIDSKMIPYRIMASEILLGNKVLERLIKNEFNEFLMGFDLTNSTKQTPEL